MTDVLDSVAGLRDGGFGRCHGLSNVNVYQRFSEVSNEPSPNHTSGQLAGSLGF